MCVRCACLLGMLCTPYPCAWHLLWNDNKWKNKAHTSAYTAAIHSTNNHWFRAPGIMLQLLCVCWQNIFASIPSTTPLLVCSALFRMCWLLLSTGCVVSHFLGSLYGPEISKHCVLAEAELRHTQICVGANANEFYMEHQTVMSIESVLHVLNMVK